MDLLLRMDVIIIIVIVLFILFGNTLLGCSNISPYEAGKLASDAARVGIEAFCGGKCGAEHYGGKEGFVNSANYAPDSNLGLANSPPISTKSWFTPNLSYSKGQKKDAGIKNILNRPSQPVPLPEGQLDMFADTPFAPECCPNAYSASMGCACMTVDQYNYLIERGGNNVPYSEY